MTAEQPLRTPSLFDTFADIDRRTRALEFGDTHALREQLGNLEQRMHDYIKELLDGVVAELTNNDAGAYYWCASYSQNVQTWATATVNWIPAYGAFLIRQHEYVFHPPAPAPGTSPPGPGVPVIPPYWDITYPEIPASASSRGAEIAAEIVARTEATTAAIIAAHELDHPRPEQEG